MKDTFGNLQGKNGIFSLTCLLFVLALLAPAGADSLWDSDFKGYIADGSGVGIGTTLVVHIAPSTKLTLTAAHIDSSEGRLSFSGGSGSGLFDFLPQASTGNTREVEEESAYSLDTQISAAVSARDENGLYYLEGERTLTINGHRETLRVAGWFSPQQVASDGSVDFGTLHRSSLEYISPGLESAQIIGPDDISRVEQPESMGPAAPTGEAAAVEETTETAGTEEGGLPTDEPADQPAAVPEGPAESLPSEAERQTGAGYQLSEEKQLQLLLRFFNRFLGTVFKP